MDQRLSAPVRSPDVTCSYYRFGLTSYHAPEPELLILRRLRLHVIDNQDRIGLLPHLELQAESFDAFKQTKAAIGVGGAAGRRLTPLAAVEVGARCPGQGEVPASLKFGYIDGGMIHIGWGHRGQLLGELGECRVLTCECGRREAGRVIGNSAFARGSAVGI